MPTGTSSLMVDSVEDIPKGSQIFINYGFRSDCQILLNYGFVTAPGENSRTRLKFSTAEFEKPFARVMKSNSEEYFEIIGMEKKLFDVFGLRTTGINYTVDPIKLCRDNRVASFAFRD